MGLLELFFPGERVSEFSRGVREQFGFELGKVLLVSVAVGLVLAVVFFFFGAVTGVESNFVGLYSLLIAFAPLVLVLLFFSYSAEHRLKKLESEAPGLLLQASIFPKGTPVSKIISFLGKKEHGLLGKEFARVEIEIGRGKSVQEALQKMKKRNRSPVVMRLVELVLIAYNSGAYLGDSFRELAEEMLEMNSMIAEKKAAMAIERFTLIAGSAVIVPFILGVLTGLVFGLDFGGIEIAGFSSTEQRAELLEIAPIANQLYIIEYALIASVFLGWLEGKPKKSFVYAIVIVPCSLAIFFFSQSLSVL